MYKKKYRKLPLPDFLAPNNIQCVDKDWLKDFDDDKDAEENTWRYWRQYSLCLKILIVIDLNFF